MIKKTDHDTIIFQTGSSFSANELAKQIKNQIYQTSKCSLTDLDKIFRSRTYSSVETSTVYIENHDLEPYWGWDLQDAAAIEVQSVAYQDCERPVVVLPKGHFIGEPKTLKVGVGFTAEPFVYKNVIRYNSNENFLRVYTTTSLVYFSLKDVLWFAEIYQNDESKN